MFFFILNQFVFLFYIKHCIVTSAENIIGGGPLLYFTNSMTFGHMFQLSQLVANSSFVKGFIYTNQDRGIWELEEVDNNSILGITTASIV